MPVRAGREAGVFFLSPSVAAVSFSIGCRRAVRTEVAWTVRRQHRRPLRAGFWITSRVAHGNNDGAYSCTKWTMLLCLLLRRRHDKCARSYIYRNPLTFLIVFTVIATLAFLAPLKLQTQHRLRLPLPIRRVPESTPGKLSLIGYSAAAP